MHKCILHFFYFLLSVVPVLGIITKLDKVEDLQINLPVIEENLASQLGVASIENRIFSTALYCKDVTPKMFRHKSIDHILSILWQTILKPEHRHIDSVISGNRWYNLWNYVSALRTYMRKLSLYLNK